MKRIIIAGIIILSVNALLIFFFFQKIKEDRALILTLDETQSEVRNGLIHRKYHFISADSSLVDESINIITNEGMRRVSDDKLVVTVESLSVSPDGRKISDGKSIRNIWEIPIVPPKVLTEEVFYNRLATLLNREDIDVVRTDFEQIFRNDNVIVISIVLDLDRQVMGTKAVQAIIELAGGEIETASFPPKALKYLNDPFTTAF